jgi:hypothetical protein
MTAPQPAGPVVITREGLDRLAVEAADLRPGAGLSRAVASSLPDVVAAIATELRGAKVPPGRSGRP